MKWTAANLVGSIDKGWVTRVTQVEAVFARLTWLGLFGAYLRKRWSEMDFFHDGKALIPMLIHCRGVAEKNKRADGIIIREHPLSTYADFPAFFDPLPPLVRFSRNLSVSIVRIFSDFFRPPLPLGAYILNGCPLSQWSHFPIRVYWCSLKIMNKAFEFEPIFLTIAVTTKSHVPWGGQWGLRQTLPTPPQSP